jgi:hypothetical protein
MPSPALILLFRRELTAPGGSLAGEQKRQEELNPLALLMNG